jgi:hypothetical protein
MEQIVVTIQGRRFSPDIGLIERLLADHPSRGRSRLSVELCELWDWRAPNGQLRDMACRNLLLRLDRAGHIALPARQRQSPNDCLETFVDRSRYRGVCCRAANWQRVGQSAGRGRNDRHHRLSVPARDLYLYPLCRDVRHRLCDDT